MLDGVVVTEGSTVVSYWDWESTAGYCGMDDACGYCGTFLWKDAETTGAAPEIRENEGFDDAAAGKAGFVGFVSPTDLCMCRVDGCFTAWTSTTSFLPLFLLVVVEEDVKLMNAMPNFPLVPLDDTSLLLLTSAFLTEFLDVVFFVETCSGVDRNSFNSEFNSVRSPPASSFFVLP